MVTIDLHLFANLSQSQTDKALQFLLMGPSLDGSEENRVDQCAAVNPIQILLETMLFVENSGLKHNVVIKGRISSFFQSRLLEFELAQNMLNY